MNKQLARLRRKPQIVVATPGRLLDHMNRGTLKLDRVHTMVLDEADEMLQMGFVKDVCKIIEATPRRPPIGDVLRHHQSGRHDHFLEVSEQSGGGGH